MCKKLIPSLLLIGSAFATEAQPTLTDANFNPQIWNTFLNIICDTANVNPGASGPGVTWDFTAPLLLIPTAVDSGSVYPCAATPNCGLFPGSDYAIYSHATRLTPYYIENAAKLTQNGYYLSADSFATYSDPIDQFQYPFTYGTNFTDTYSGILHYGPGTHAVEAGSINVNCDGYGTLKLPGVPGVSSPLTLTNVLRVHSTQSFADSLFLFGLPFAATFTLETYAWYMPNYHSALMTILYTTETDGIGNYKNKAVSIAPFQVAVGTPNIQNTFSSLAIFPNPVKDELYVKYSTVNNEKVHISLSDLLGRNIAVIADVFTQGDQNISYNTNDIPKGLYLIHFQSGAETITWKIEIQ